MDKSQAEDMKTRMARNYIQVIENQERVLVSQLQEQQQALDNLRAEIGLCKQALEITEAQPDAIVVPPS
jgi:hypothetical protein